MANLTKADDKSLQAYEEKLIEQQNQTPPQKYNVIKISYDTEAPDTLGQFVYAKEGDTEFRLLGDNFTGVILAKRHQYNYFDENDKTNNMRTSQFEDWKDQVDVYVGGDMKEQVFGIAKWMKDHYSKDGATPRTYQSVFYVLYKEEVYLVRGKGSSFTNFIEFEKEIDANKTLFSFNVDFGHTKEKKGTVTYYPITFTKGKDIEGDAYHKNLTKSFEIDQMIADLNNPASEGEVDMVKEAEGAFEKKAIENLPF